MKSLLLVLLLLFPASALADCNMAFRYGLVIGPEHILFVQNTRTYVQINENRQLFVVGEWVQLNDADTELLEQYSQGLRKFVPEIVSLAVDGVELGLSSIESMLSGLGSKSQQAEWQALIRETTFQFMSRFVRTGEYFYLAPQSLNELDHFLNRELKPQLNNLARHTVGAVWGALRADSQGLESVEQLVDNISFGQDEKAIELEEKSALFCQRMRELDEIETSLQQRIPLLSQYDVVTEKN